MKPEPGIIMVPREFDDVDTRNTYVIRFLDNTVFGKYLAADNCPFAFVDRGSGCKVEWSSNDYEFTNNIVKAARYSMEDAYRIAEVLSNDEAFLDRCIPSSIFDELTEGVDWHDSESIKDGTDNVNHPAHYENYSIECIDSMVETQGRDAVIAFCICNAFKYLWRHRAKNGFEDIKKANWYLNKAVELEGKNDEQSNK